MLEDFANAGTIVGLAREEKRAEPRVGALLFSYMILLRCNIPCLVSLNADRLLGRLEASFRCASAAVP
jgi:hypothetical protein